MDEAAMTSGAEFTHGWVKQISQSEDEVTIEIDELNLRTKVAVIATGAAVELVQHLGLVKQQKPSAIAIRKYVKSEERLIEIILSYDRSLLPGYAWIIPLPDNWYNVGCGVTVRSHGEGHDNLKKMLGRFTEKFEPVKSVMRRAKSISPISGAALRTGLMSLSRCVKGRILCAGETIGTTFPFTGEGIGKAMHSAEIAADLIDAALNEDDFGTLSDYDRVLNKRIRPLYKGYLLAERWLSRPWLNDFVAGRIKASRFLQNRVVEFMNETGDPSRLYSPCSILKSYWK